MLQTGIKLSMCFGHVDLSTWKYEKLNSDGSVLHMGMCTATHYDYEGKIVKIITKPTGCNLIEHAPYTGVSLLKWFKRLFIT